jgi:AAA ATPase-like protein
MVRAEEPAAGPLLERAAEVAAITAAIDAAVAGSGSVLLVEGAAGIGKTRLLAHACERATAAGMTVLTARAAEYEDGYPGASSRSCSTVNCAVLPPGRGRTPPRWRPGR